MIFANIARALNAACVHHFRQANIHANYVHEHAQTEGAWNRCVETARLWDACIDLEIEIEDLIAERKYAAAERVAA